MATKRTAPNKCRGCGKPISLGDETGLYRKRPRHKACVPPSGGKVILEPQCDPDELARRMLKLILSLTPDETKLAQKKDRTTPGE
jgi:hypothetical protein